MESWAVPSMPSGTMPVTVTRVPLPWAANVTSIVTSLRVVHARRAPGSQMVMVPRTRSSLAVVLDDAPAEARFDPSLDEPPRLVRVDRAVAPPLVVLVGEDV